MNHWMKIHEPGIYKYLTHKYVKSGHQCQLILGQLPPWIPNGFCSWGSWVILKQGAVVSLFALMVNCGACFLLALARCNSLKENGSCWEIVDLILVCLLQIRLLYKSLAPTLRLQVVEGAGRTDSSEHLPCHRWCMSKNGYSRLARWTQCLQHLQHRVVDAKHDVSDKSRMTWRSTGSITAFLRFYSPFEIETDETADHLQIKDQKIRSWTADQSNCCWATD